MIKHNHLGPIRAGHQIYASRLEVAGLVHRKHDAQRFVRGREQRLELKREPSNPHDVHAILIVGRWRGWLREHRATLGYVPRAVAAAVAAEGVFDVIVPRLARSYMSDRGHVDIYFQITGPKAGAKAFKEALSS